MQSTHAASAVSVSFSEPNLVAHAGLIAGVRLAERCGLGELIEGRVAITGAANSAGANAGAKVTSVVAGMLAGADSINDCDVLRHGATDRLFAGVRAPSTLGSFLRAFTWGHVRQLESATREFTRRLAAETGLLTDADAVVYLDIDSKIKQVYGAKKQGASHGYTRVKGLHFQIVTARTPTSAPVIVATRLRKGSAGSAKGAASLIAEAITAVRAMGAAGLIILRADSAFFSHKVAATCRAHNVRFSLTVANRKKICSTIAAIAADGWQTISYPQAIWDEEQGCWISDAEVAEITYTAFTGKAKRYHTGARLIVRRVKRLSTSEQPPLPGEPSNAWRYHCVFTNSTFDLIDAEANHRDHAHIEQVFADLEDSALAHLPSGKFTANAAWLTLAALTYNLTRALGVLASPFHAKARTGTIRAHLITIPGRIASTARTLHLRLPTTWPWADAVAGLWINTGHPLRT
jgi:hypothetical protein